MILLVKPDGAMKCIYGEAIDLAELGELHVSRASHVEPDEQGQWWLDLSPVAGPVLGPFTFRSLALTAEIQWLEQHWLTPRHR